jgi:hypothetical protein
MHVLGGTINRLRGCAPPEGRFTLAHKDNEAAN